MQAANERARAMDSAERPVEAIAAYEVAITDPAADLDTFLDLAVLYFVCNDFGYAAHHSLPDSLTEKTWGGIDATLNEAINRFGQHPEIVCWRHFIDFIIGKTERIDRDDCEALLVTGQTLLPYLCLYGSFVGLDPETRSHYRAGAEELLEKVSAGRTARQRYVRSVLQSALRK